MPYEYDGHTWDSTSSESSSSDDLSHLHFALRAYLHLYMAMPALARPTTTCTLFPPQGAPALQVFTGAGTLEERTLVLVECLERRFPIDDVAISNPAFGLTTLMPTLTKLEYSIEVWTRTRPDGFRFGAWEATIACKDANGTTLSVDGEEAKFVCWSPNQYGNCHAYHI